MKKRTFITYAAGDEDSVKELYDALSRLQNLEIHVPEWISTEKQSLTQKITEGLNGASLVIVLITFNSTNTMWLNQEIGYACAKNLPIISIVEKGIDVKGFLEGQQHIIFQRGNFKANVHQVISKLRQIFSISNFPITHFQIKCPTCEKDYFELLPSQKDIDNMVETSQKFNYICSFCSSALYIDPATLASQPKSS